VDVLEHERVGGIFVQTAVKALSGPDKVPVQARPV
jgi:hypothetical protein